MSAAAIAHAAALQGQAAVILGAEAARGHGTVEPYEALYGLYGKSCGGILGSFAWENGSSSGAYLGGVAALRRADVDADAGYDPGEAARAVGRGLGQNAADLAATHKDVVNPLYTRSLARDALYRLCRSHSRGGCEQLCRRRRRELGAQQQGKVYTAARR